MHIFDMNRSLPAVLHDGDAFYVYGLDLIARITASGPQADRQRYYHSDGLGSTRAVTDANGNVDATYHYDAFGAVRSSTGSIANDFRFTGEQLDGETGYYFLRARYYDPAIGRFVTRDPFPGLDTLSLTINSYVYSTNNPANLTDPGGQCPICAAVLPVLWGMLELGLSGADAVATAQTLSDSSVSFKAKLANIGLLTIGLITPGGGFSAAARMTKARELGLLGEKLAGISGRKAAIASELGTAARRIPDQISQAENIMREIKNVAELSYTKQLRDLVAIARREGYIFELIVREDTSLSGPLQAAIDRGELVLRRILP